MNANKKANGHGWMEKVLLSTRIGRRTSLTIGRELTKTAQACGGRASGTTFLARPSSNLSAREIYLN